MLARRPTSPTVLGIRGCGQCLGGGLCGGGGQIFSRGALRQMMQKGGSEYMEESLKEERRSHSKEIYREVCYSI